MRRILSSAKSGDGIKILILLFFSLLAGVGGVMFFSYFKVKNIRVDGGLKSVQIFGLTGMENENMFILKEDAVEKHIKDANPGIAHVTIKKQFPHTLLINVTFYKPVVSLKADKGYLLLSSDGRIIGRSKKQDHENIPTLHYYQPVHYETSQPGSYLSHKDILMALFFVEKSLSLGLPVNSVDIDSIDMIGLNSDGKTIVFSSEKEKELQVYQMEKIIRQFKIEGKNFKKMDLRFNKPVLEIIQ